MDIGNAQASDMTNVVKNYSVLSMNTDGVQDQDETTYQNSNWTKQWGYFNQIPELKSAVLMKAIWTVGKGFNADAETQVVLDNIRGWGKDTFEDILFNMCVISYIGGDSYAEIITDGDTGELVNVKVLDTGTMKIVVDRKGILKEYRQTSKIKGAVEKTFKPEQIFHLSNNRLADQIHGISDIDAIEDIIKADKENFDDMKKIMHRGARPMILWKLKTDDTTKIAQFVSRIDAARNLGEDMFIPDDEDLVTHEVVQVDVSANVLAWRDDMKNKFYRALGLPLIIFGSGANTESGGKVEYLAHEQVFEYNQKRIERQILEQLNLRIDLVSPVSLLENLQTDENKDQQQAIQFQQSETQGLK